MTYMTQRSTQRHRVRPHGAARPVDSGSRSSGGLAGGFELRSLPRRFRSLRLVDTRPEHSKKPSEKSVHRVSSPWLKLLSAVGVILILIMKKGKSSAQHSRGDNQIQADWATYAADTRPRSLEEPSIGEVGCAPRK